MKFAWTTLRVSDLDRSIAFYSDVLSLAPMARMGTDAHRVVMFGRDGETKVELIWEASPLPDAVGGGVSLGFIPDDLDAFMARLDGLGIPPWGPCPLPRISAFSSSATRTATPSSSWSSDNKNQTEEN